MSIVESDQAFAVFAMQAKAIAQSMRTLRTRFNPLDRELDEILACRVGKEHVAVEKQEGVKARIACLLTHVYVIT